jgi:rhodanese-related sulfurtransferase
MKSTLSRRILSIILWSGAILLFSSSSPAVQMDSGSLYISMESILSTLKKKQDIFLIDVRGDEAFEKFRIPGSIRIPLYAVKTKEFLKDKPLILISEGYPDSALEQGCSDLRDMGFKRVFILNGGLNYWKEKNGPLEGDAFSLQEVNKVPPSVFYKEKGSMYWLVIDISQPGAESVIPRAVRLPCAGNREAFVPELKRVIEENPGPSSRALLICDEKGQGYSSVEPLIRKGKIKRVFYLSGGLEAYKVFLHLKEEASRSAKEVIRKCPTCP